MFTNRVWMARARRDDSGDPSLMFPSDNREDCPFNCRVSMRLRGGSTTIHTILFKTYSLTLCTFNFLSHLPQSCVWRHRRLPCRDFWLCGREAKSRPLFLYCAFTKRKLIKMLFLKKWKKSTPYFIEKKKKLLLVLIE